MVIGTGISLWRYLAQSQVDSQIHAERHIIYLFICSDILVHITCWLHGGLLICRTRVSSCTHSIRRWASSSEPCKASNHKTSMPGLHSAWFVLYQYIYCVYTVSSTKCTPFIWLQQFARHAVCSKSEAVTRDLIAKTEMMHVRRDSWLRAQVHLAVNSPKLSTLRFTETQNSAHSM